MLYFPPNYHVCLNHHNPVGPNAYVEFNENSKAHIVGKWFFFPSISVGKTGVTWVGLVVRLAVSHACVWMWRGLSLRKAGGNGAAGRRRGNHLISIHHPTGFHLH